ncbi:unnamed protein product [marine sediment metagenome]|uniref:HNH domain-containing protein n=1 Tax=marine sediment metagenome TaxID=412755 RepID=X1D4Y8_9ZZZZ
MFGSQEGTYDPENVATACNDCHAQPNHGKLKGAKTVFEQDDSEIRRLEAKYR